LKSLCYDARSEKHQNIGRSVFSLETNNLTPHFDVVNYTSIAASAF